MMTHIPKITIEVVDHASQRYNTCGDWMVNEDGSVTILVSKMENWKHEAAVALHEYVEVLDCISKGITQERVDKFDLSFELLRDDNPEIIGDMEPGDMLSAPYFDSHDMAKAVEREYIWRNKIDTEAYEKDINNL